jgi:hypothetical protein
MFDMLGGRVFQKIVGVLMGTCICGILYFIFYKFNGIDAINEITKT